MDVIRMVKELTSMSQLFKLSGTGCCARIQNLLMFPMTELQKLTTSGLWSPIRQVTSHEIALITCYGAASLRGWQRFSAICLSHVLCEIQDIFCKC